MPATETLTEAEGSIVTAGDPGDDGDVGDPGDLSRPAVDLLSVASCIRRCLVSDDHQLTILPVAPTVRPSVADGKDPLPIRYSLTPMK